MARRNPSLFGQDLIKRGKQALGLAVTAGVNEKFVWPQLKNAVPGGGMGSQVAHGLTNIGVAFGVGKLFGMVGQRNLGELMQEGGTILGVGEIILSPIPGATIAGSFPTSLPWGKTPAVTPPVNPLLLSPGNGPALPAVSTVGLGHTFSGI